jgi:hypothetical protein
MQHLKEIYMRNALKNTIKTVAVLAVVAGTMASFSAQAADVRWNVTIGLPGVVQYQPYPPQVVYPAPVVVYQQPQVVYQQPQVVYQQPQVVYQQPQVVYQQPRVVYRQPQVVYAQPQVIYQGGHHRGHGHGYGHRGYGQVRYGY